MVLLAALLVGMIIGWAWLKILENQRLRHYKGFLEDCEWYTDLCGYINRKLHKPSPSVNQSTFDWIEDYKQRRIQKAKQIGAKYIRLNPDNSAMDTIYMEVNTGKLCSFWSGGITVDDSEHPGFEMEIRLIQKSYVAMKPNEALPYSYKPTDEYYTCKEFSEIKRLDQEVLEQTPDILQWHDKLIGGNVQ